MLYNTLLLLSVNRVLDIKLILSIKFKSIIHLYMHENERKKKLSKNLIIRRNQFKAKIFKAIVQLFELVSRIRQEYQKN